LSLSLVWLRKTSDTRDVEVVGEKVLEDNYNEAMARKYATNYVLSHRGLGYRILGPKGDVIETRAPGEIVRKTISPLRRD
jgi:hypothetical protein